MHPHARTTAFDLEQHDTGAVLRDRTTRAAHAVSPLELAVWLAADGTRSVEQIAAQVGVSAADVSVELDRLADAGLLAQRFAPPVEAPVARRSLLRTLAGASLGGAVLLASNRADALTGGAMEKRKKAQEHQEHALKQKSAFGGGANEQRIKAQQKEFRLRISGGKGTVEGEIELESIVFDSNEKGDFLSFAFESSVFGQQGREVKELADILKSDYAAKSAVTVEWGAEFENTFKGTIASLDVGYSLFLPEGTPVRMEVLITFQG